MTDREQELLAALKVIAMFACDHSFGRAWNDEVDGFCPTCYAKSKIASADASASRAVSPDQQAVIEEMREWTLGKPRPRWDDVYDADKVDATVARWFAALSPQEPR